MDKNKPNSFGYKIGYVLATVVVFCLTALVVGLTIKFLFWLF